VDEEAVDQGRAGGLLRNGFLDKWIVGAFWRMEVAGVLSAHDSFPSAQLNIFGGVCSFGCYN
jgi:hypothetical protein